jgi:hypothetical protein
MSSLGDYMPNSLLEWSPAIGAGVQGVGALAARMFLSPDSWFARHSEVTGVFAAVLAAGGMALSPSTRGAVGGTIAGAVASAAPRLIESMVAKAPVAGVGYYAAETANPMLGMVRADQINGLGYATAQPQPHAYGTVPGVAGAVAGPIADNGHGAPVNLLGPPTHHMQLAARYGATHISH